MRENSKRERKRKMEQNMEWNKNGKINILIF
jgi:hypothetical protein